MCYKEKAVYCSEEVDAGQNLQNPMLTRIPATTRPDLTKTKDTAISGEKRSFFLKAHFSMSGISTPLPTWRLQYVHIVL